MIIENFQTKYVKTCRARIKKDKYQSTGNTALQIYSIDGTPLCTATVNPPDPLNDRKSIKLEPHLVAIKEWSENEGVIQALIYGGVIKPACIEAIGSGYVVIKVYELTDQARAELGV